MKLKMGLVTKQNSAENDFITHQFTITSCKIVSMRNLAHPRYFSRRLPWLLTLARHFPWFTCVYIFAVSKLLISLHSRGLFLRARQLNVIQLKLYGSCDIFPFLFPFHAHTVCLLSLVWPVWLNIFMCHPELESPTPTLWKDEGWGVSETFISYLGSHTVFLVLVITKRQT